MVNVASRVSIHTVFTAPREKTHQPECYEQRNDGTTDYGCNFSVIKRIELKKEIERSVSSRFSPASTRPGAAIGWSCRRRRRRLRRCWRRASWTAARACWSGGGWRPRRQPSAEYGAGRETRAAHRLSVGTRTFIQSQAKVRLCAANNRSEFIFFKCITEQFFFFLNASLVIWHTIRCELAKPKRAYES